MEMRLSNTIYAFLLVILFFCKEKGQEDKKIKIEKKETINFFDKKYLSLFSLDANLQVPVRSYYDNKVGDFTIYYVGKTKELQESWYNFD